MHKDLCLDNIFVGPPWKNDGTINFEAKGEPFKDDEGDTFYRASREQVGRTKSWANSILQTSEANRALLVATSCDCGF